MKIIGFDFSIEKPACCIYDTIQKTYKFKSWAWNLSPKLTAIYEDANVEVIERKEPKLKNLGVSEKMQHDVHRGIFLSQLIINSFTKEELEDSWILWEGLSFASSGNVVLQLGGFKYLVMKEFCSDVPLEKQLTYAPQTIKKTAGCSTQIIDPITGKKRSQGKPEMIQAFVDTKLDITLRNKMDLERESFRKKGDRNWIDHLDDLIDSYWLIKTFLDKNEI
jgi:hypothetical protein